MCTSLWVGVVSVPNLTRFDKVTHDVGKTCTNVCAAPVACANDHACGIHQVGHRLCARHYGIYPAVQDAKGGVERSGFHISPSFSGLPSRSESADDDPLW